MWNNKILFSSAFVILLIVVPIFNLVHASPAKIVKINHHRHKAQTGHHSNRGVARRNNTELNKRNNDESSSDSDGSSFSSNDSKSTSVSSSNDSGTASVSSSKDGGTASLTSSKDSGTASMSSSKDSGTGSLTSSKDSSTGSISDSNDRSDDGSESDSSSTGNSKGSSENSNGYPNIESTIVYLKDDIDGAPLGDEKFSPFKINEPMRILKAGDIFTPHELLPITKRLKKKLEIPIGKGKGIVSGSRNPEDMADRIFSLYFITTKRIVILKAQDIAGLHALQALATEEHKKDKDKESFIKESFPHLTEKTKKQRLKNVEKKKKVKPKKNRLKKQRNRRRTNKLQMLEAAMSKHRHLIINSKHGKQKTSKKTSLAFRKALMQPRCSWTYECSDETKLETCNLKAKCDDEILSNGPTPNNAKHPGKVMNASFRRAIGLSVLDEAVENIIAKHALLVKPDNKKQQQQIQNLDEYFNEIIMNTNRGLSTPHTPLKLDEISEGDNNDTDEKKSKKDSSGDEEVKSYIAQINDEKLRWPAPPFGIPLRSNGAVSKKNMVIINKKKPHKNKDTTATAPVIKLVG